MALHLGGLEPSSTQFCVKGPQDPGACPGPDTSLTGYTPSLGLSKPHFPPL